VLYSPVKSLVPMIFPIILDKKKELEEENAEEDASIEEL
jgi:membrane protein required for colicin V production